MQHIITAQYGDMPVLFQNDAFINATAIASGFGKKAKDYLKTDRTVDYIKALINHLNSGIESNGIKIPFQENQLVVVKKGSSANGGGTWFHPKLAIDFARWLSADFAVWCDMQIEKILHPLPYGLKSAPIQLAAPRAKKMVKGGLELWQQDAINDLIKERLAYVPQDRKASMAIRMYSAIGTKFDIPKGTKDGYKNIAPEHFDNIMLLIARLPIDGSQLLAFTADELDAMVAERVADQLKALPSPAKEGEFLPNPTKDELIGILTRQVTALEAQLQAAEEEKPAKMILAIRQEGHMVIEKGEDLPSQIVMHYVSPKRLGQLIRCATDRLEQFLNGAIAANLAAEAAKNQN